MIRPCGENRGVFCLVERSALIGAVQVTVVVAWMTWGWKSPTGPTRGTVSRTAKVSTVRWNLKEAEGKALARRTGIAYKAAAVGKKGTVKRQIDAGLRTSAQE